jgi:hypothetical protein
MKNETRNVIYMALDLLNSMNRTSQESSLLRMNDEMYNEVKSEIYEILSESKWQSFNEQKFVESKTNVGKKTEIIGLLPSMLFDKNKFKNNQDIAKLAKDSLNMEIPSWKKRSRNEIVGVLISMIVVKPDDELELFYEAWKRFTQEDKNNKNISNDSRDYVDLWLEYFKKYRE